MWNRFLIILFVFQSYFSTFSQEKRLERINWFHSDDTSKFKFKHTYFAPLILSSSSLITLGFREKIQKKTQSLFPNFETNIDDFTQYTPIGILYFSDLLKLNARHSIWNQTKFLFISQAVSGLIIQSLKYTIKMERPDGSAFNSFPSGHTGVAFVSSQVLFNEYKNTYPFIAYSGYLFSSGTAVLRVLNNEHWLPDVLMSAGIGILVTNVVYSIEPFKNWNPFKKQRNITFTPIFDSNSTGFYLSLGL